MSEREREREKDFYVIKINYYTKDIAQNARSSTMTGSCSGREKKASAIKKKKEKRKRISRLRLPIKNISPHEYIIVIGSTFYTRAIRTTVVESFYDFIPHP